MIKFQIRKKNFLNPTTTIPYHTKNRNSVVTCPRLHFLNSSLEMRGFSGLFPPLCDLFKHKIFNMQCLKCFHLQDDIAEIYFWYFICVYICVCVCVFFIQPSDSCQTPRYFCQNICYCIKKSVEAMRVTEADNCQVLLIVDSVMVLL